MITNPSEKSIYEILKAKKFSEQEIESFILAVRAMAQNVAMTQLLNQRIDDNNKIIVEESQRRMKIDIITWMAILFVIQIGAIIIGILYLKK